MVLGGALQGWGGAHCIVLGGGGTKLADQGRGLCKAMSYSPPPHTCRAHPTSCFAKAPPSTSPPPRSIVGGGHRATTGAHQHGDPDDASSLAAATGGGPPASPGPSPPLAVPGGGYGGIPDILGAGDREMSLAPGGMDATVGTSVARRRCRYGDASFAFPTIPVPGGIGSAGCLPEVAGAVARLVTAGGEE